MRVIYGFFMWFPTDSSMKGFLLVVWNRILHNVGEDNHVRIKSIFIEVTICWNRPSRKFKKCLTWTVFHCSHLQSLHYLHTEGHYRKVSVQIRCQTDAILWTNHALFTLSENRMSTLPSENPEDANSRSFWMVRVCVCIYCVSLSLSVYFRRGRIRPIHQIAFPSVSPVSMTLQSKQTKQFCGSGFNQCEQGFGVNVSSNQCTLWIGCSQGRLLCSCSAH